MTKSGKNVAELVLELIELYEKHKRISKMFGPAPTMAIEARRARVRLAIKRAIRKDLTKQCGEATATKLMQKLNELLQERS